jgi:hypothetical protein
MRRSVVAFAIVAGLLLGPSVAAEKFTKETFFNQVEKTAAGDLAALRSLLVSLDVECPEANQACPAAAELHRAIVGDGGKLLPLLVVYLDENLEMKANRLIWKDRVTPFIRDAQNVWVVVFSDRKITLEASLERLWAQEETLTKGLRDVFISSGKRSIEDEQGRALVKPIELTDLARDDAGAEPLWIGRERFLLMPDTAYRLRIYPADEESEAATSFKVLQASFTNSANKSLDFGLGIAATFVDGLDQPPGMIPTDIDGIVREHYVLNAYWMLQIYIKDPVLVKPIAPKRGSRYRTSYAVTIGANLNVFELNELLIGLNIGHLFGRNGIVVGANFLNPFEDVSGADEVKPFVGVNFNF